MTGDPSIRNIPDKEDHKKTTGLITWLAFSVVCIIMIYTVFDIAMNSQ